MKLESIEVSTGVTEASGVARQGDQPIIVTDATPGVYYTLDIGRELGPLIDLSLEKLARHELQGATLAIDFESRPYSITSSTNLWHRPKFLPWLAPLLPPAQTP